MPVCLILQESMMERTKSEIKVEQSPASKDGVMPLSALSALERNGCGSVDTNYRKGS